MDRKDFIEQLIKNVEIVLRNDKDLSEHEKMEMRAMFGKTIELYIGEETVDSEYKWFLMKEHNKKTGKIDEYIGCCSPLDDIPYWQPMGDHDKLVSYKRITYREACIMSGCDKPHEEVKD